MVKIQVVSTPLTNAKTDAVGVFVFQGVDVARQEARAVDAALGGALADLVRLGDFRAKFKETRWLPTRGALAAPRVAFVGLGKPAEFSLDVVREAAARLALAARDARLKTLAFALPSAPAGARAPPRAIAQAAAEGLELGLFEFREYKSAPAEGEDPPGALEAVHVVETRGARAAAVRAGVADGQAVAEATNLARTLIVRPSIAKAPEVLARVAQTEARRHRVSCQVLGPAELKKLGMHALLGVGSGSARPPRLVVLQYRGGRRRVLLCGKGITFDSGGINIKPSEGMDRMKYDMAGSATVLAVALAAARLRLPLTVVALMAVAENMPSGSAIRPGDVLVSYTKKTIEVGNTDAEGRLVLADALGYGVARFKPDFVVDVATLTGAVRIALGNITTGILGNDDTLVQRLIDAGKRTGDDLWQLPLTKAYEKQVQSEIADLKNVGAAGTAGCIAGAAFLKQFVGDRRWAHLDIAGTCWTEKGPADLNKEYLPKGPTGIGVRLLTEWLRGL